MHSFISFLSCLTSYAVAGVRHCNDVAGGSSLLPAFQNSQSRSAFQQADPQILEPIYHVEVLCPDDLTGAVMGDLQSRRAIVEGIDSEGHFQKVIAKVPLAEMDGYSSSLRSITQGRAKFAMNFKAYEAVPFELQRKLIDDYSKSAKEELV